MTNIFKIPLITLLLVYTTSAALAQSKTPLKLWYDKPSGNTWENALPVGNGRLAAMVYGNVAEEKLQLNESTVWTGSPNRNDNPDAMTALPEIRSLIFAGKYKEAQALAGKTIQTKKSNGQMYQPVGNLLLTFPGHEHFTNYYRELNLENAVTSTSYTVDGVTYSRSVFASVPAQVIVVHLTTSKKGSLNFSARLKTPQPAATLTTGNNSLLINGATQSHETVKGGKLKFNGIVHFTTDGTVSKTDSAISVTNATSADIFISIATNFINYQDIFGNEKQLSEAYLAKASTQSYTQLLAAHTAAYQKYFNRVSLYLGTTDAANNPTDVRLKNFYGGNDPQLAVLYFQYGRYLLISSSQPGGQPANLQGIWNDKMSPPWDSKYTININTQMNYWPAEKTGLSEMHGPLLQMVKELAEAGKETAKTMYGARGWMAHHNTDIWRITGPVDNIYWAVWSMGGAWLGQHLWEHYLYTGDKKFLAEIYPILKGAALFFVDDLVEDPRNHWLVINPGTSPENEPKPVPERKGTSIDAGCTMDNQIVYDAFTAAIHAAKILHTDAALCDSFAMYRKRLPPMHIGKHGQLQEWLQDLDDPADKHRHISHLYGLFPSQQISPVRTPELFSAANTTLLQRGDISTGWSMGWKVNWWARMLNGDHALMLIKNQLSPVGVRGGGGTYNNLFDAHAPFQIDGNFGCTSGIAEMLVQSHDGELQLLPALPAEWKNGEVKGLKARGGFEVVEMAWVNGVITKLILRSALGGNCRLRLPQNTVVKTIAGFKKATGVNPNPFYFTEQVAAPIIAEPAQINPPAIAPTKDWDLPTVAGKVYKVI